VLMCFQSPFSGALHCNHDGPRHLHYVGELSIPIFRGTSLQPGRRRRAGWRRGLSIPIFRGTSLQRSGMLSGAGHMRLSIPIFRGTSLQQVLHGDLSDKNKTFNPHFQGHFTATESLGAQSG